MAHILRITDGTTTITLSSGDMYIADYVPRVGRDDRPITEPLTIGFSGGVTTARANVQILNRLLLQAANYDRNRAGKRVYAEFDPDTSGTVYRSKLYNGIVEMTPDVLGGQWGSGTVELNISWTRQPFWDGPLTQVPLSNTSASSTTDGIAINNRNDAAGENWASISSSDVVGDLPSPIKIEMLNATTDANATDEIYFWHNVYSTPLLFNTILEGEASTSGTSTTDATSNSLAYGAFTWSEITETKFAEWTIPSTDLVDAAGGRFSVLARWPSVFPYTDCSLRLKLETPTTYDELWKGPLSLIAPTTDTYNQRELNQLGTLRLPPDYIPGQAAPAPIVLSVYGVRATTDTHAVNIDYLQLSPVADEYGWLRFRAVDPGIGIDQTLLHDETEGYTHLQNSSGQDAPRFTAYGGPILLTPNVDQKIYINTCDYLGISDIAQTWTVKLWYRPRRNAL